MKQIPKGDFDLRAGVSTVILADVSSSMEGMPYQRLKDALNTIWPDMKGKLFAFSYGVKPVEHPSDLPPPDGGTALHLALAQAAVLNPSKVIVLCDGHPDNPDLCLQVAEEINGVIDVIFCGHDNDDLAIEFMNKLTRIGGGQVVLRDLHDAKQLLAPAIRDLLQIEGPIAL